MEMAEVVVLCRGKKTGVNSSSQPQRRARIVRLCLELANTLLNMPRLVNRLSTSASALRWKLMSISYTSALVARPSAVASCSLSCYFCLLLCYFAMAYCYRECLYMRRCLVRMLRDLRLRATLCSECDLAVGRGEHDRALRAVEGAGVLERDLLAEGLAWSRGEGVEVGEGVRVGPGSNLMRNYIIIIKILARE